MDWSIPDLNREKPTKFWDPPKKLLKSIRAYQQTNNIIFKKICVIRHIFWSVVSGADIPLNCKIGGGLILIHGNGIVINPESEIGANCIILQQVTLAGKIKIGYNVNIGAGAKIISAEHKNRTLIIGNNVVIGANAVVTKDIESNVTVVGVPARPIKSNN